MIEEDYSELPDESSDSSFDLIVGLLRDMLAGIGFITALCAFLFWFFTS